MSKPKAIGLVYVYGGVAHIASPNHVDIRLVDEDDMRVLKEDCCGSQCEGYCHKIRETLPSGLGYEELCEDLGITECVNFRPVERSPP